MKNTVVFDVDGVLADFEGQLVSVLEKKFGAIGHAKRNMFRLEDRFSDRVDVMRYAQTLTEDPNFYYGLGNILSMPFFADQIAGNGKLLMFVSSRPLSAENFTRRWLNKKTYSDFQLFCGIKDKAGFLQKIKDSVDFIIEDSPEQIENLKKAGFTVLCFDQEWNKGIFPRLYVRNDLEVMLWAEESVEAEPFFEQEIEQ